MKITKEKLRQIVEEELTIAVEAKRPRTSKETEEMRRRQDDEYLRRTGRGHEASDAPGVTTLSKAELRKLNKRSKPKKSKLKEELPVAENIYSKQANMPLEDEADDIIMDAEADDIMGFLDNLPPDEKLEIINMLMDDLYQANPDLADDFDRMKRSS